MLEPGVIVLAAIDFNEAQTLNPTELAMKLCNSARPRA
jgi:hypothetical protein